MTMPKIPPGASLSMHICMSVDAALDMALGRNGYQPEQDANGVYQITPDSWPNKIKDILGYPPDARQSEIVSDLEGLLKAGQEYIPGDGCDNWQPLGRCKGHIKRGIPAGKLHR